MTYTETQLEAIKILGRKDLGFGCLIFRKEKQIIHQMDSHDIPCDEGEIWRERGNAEPYLLTKNFEILGHIPHLEDLCIAIQKRIDADIHDIAGYIIDGINLEIFSWRNPEGIKKEINLSNNTWTQIHCIEYDPIIPLLDQPSLPDILNLFK